MRIAQVTYSYQPITGGADAYADLLCRTFRERGHEAWVYQRAAATHDPFVRTAPGLLRLFGYRDFWLVPFWLKGRRRELSRMDVLIGHYPNYCAAVYFHPKLIGLSHGVTWDDAPGTWRSQEKKRLAQAAFARCPRFVSNDTFFLREMGLDIAPGERPFQEVTPDRWFIPNCVDTTRFRPQEGLAREPRIVVPRNLYRNRGVHLAVEAFALLAGDFPETELHLVGAESQPDYAQEIHRRVAALGLGTRVRFVGSVLWEAMPSVYSAARLCLVPSLCGEGTSLAALEAMACGTATVTTNVAGLADLPTLQCEPSAESLAEGVRAVLPRWEAVGDQQRQAVERGFGLERWTAAWREVVEDWE